MATSRLPIVISLIVCTLIAYRNHLRHPFGDRSIGDKTDHQAHMHVARLFPRLGFRLHREPLTSLLSPLDDEAVLRLAPDERSIIAHDRSNAFAVPTSRPAYVSWGSLPRPYPPGDMVAFAPIALLYELTSITRAFASFLLIATCLVFAHAGLWVLLQSIQQEWRTSTVVHWCVLALVAVPILLFALDGFYDVILIAPIALSARWLRDGRWTHAALAFAVAFFFHYRALFFLPYALVAVARVCRAYRDLDRPGILRLAASAGFAGSALLTLAMVRPSLAAFPLTNPVHLASGHPVATAGYLMLAVLVVSAFSTAGARLDAAIALTIFAILLAARQVQAWRHRRRSPVARRTRRRERSNGALRLGGAAPSRVHDGLRVCRSRELIRA